MYIQVFYGHILSEIQYQEMQSVNRYFQSYPISRLFL